MTVKVKRKARDKTLNKKQQLFAMEYMIDMNATQAALRAGYSAHTAYSQGQRLLKNVEIKRLIDVETDKRKERLRLTADDVVKGISEIALTGQQEHNRLKAYELLGKTRDMNLFNDKIIERETRTSDTDNALLALLTNAQVIKPEPKTEDKDDSIPSTIVNN